MDERIFSRLATLLESGPVAVASVLATRGATPRKRGSRMLVTTEHAEFSIGGGEAEARVVAAARALLACDASAEEFHIDLSGGADSAGVCGGTMDLALRRWAGAVDHERARQLSRLLAAGDPCELSPGELGGGDKVQQSYPDARLLIVGGGHCAHALCELARHLDFELLVYDPHGDPAGQSAFPGARTLASDTGALAQALATSRAVYAVLLNRDFASDVTALAVLRTRPPVFIGMMGSRRRIAEVTRALGDDGTFAKQLQAPVGLDIDAETPHEIAVSILAQLIAARRARNP